MAVFIHGLVLGDTRFLNESLDIYLCVCSLTGDPYEYEDVKVVWDGYLY